MQQIRPLKGLAPANARQWLRIGPVVALCFGFAALGWWAAIDPDQLVDVGDKRTLARVIAAVIGAGFALFGLGGLVALLIAGNRLPRFVADDEGLAIWTRFGHAEIPWDDIAAVGVGYKITPRVTTVKLPEGHAIEIFLNAPDPAQRFPTAKALVVDEDPPRPGLPSKRIRFLPLLDNLDAVIGNQVDGRAPYLGSYQRAWHPLPGQ